jgi:hypothetical protein
MKPLVRTPSKESVNPKLLIRPEIERMTVRPELVEGLDSVPVSTSSTRTESKIIRA